MTNKTCAGRLFVLTILTVSAVMLLSACGRTNLGYRPPTDVDVIDKRAKASLPFDVTDFQWTYLPGGRQLKVTGSIRNNGRTPAGGFVYALMFDEDGIGTAMGEGLITPGVIQPGESGSFTVVAQTNRPQSLKPLKAIRLLTNTQRD